MMDIRKIGEQYILFLNDVASDHKIYDTSYVDGKYYINTEYNSYQIIDYNEKEIKTIKDNIEYTIIDNYVYDNSKCVVCVLYYNKKIRYFSYEKYIVICNIIGNEIYNNYGKYVYRLQNQEYIIDNDILIIINTEFSVYKKITIVNLINCNKFLKNEMVEYFFPTTRNRILNISNLIYISNNKIFYPRNINDIGKINHIMKCGFFIKMNII